MEEAHRARGCFREKGREPEGGGHLLHCSSLTSELAVMHLDEWLDSALVVIRHLKVPSHDFFLLHNKFAFGEYIHVHSVVLKVWFVKCSQITKFTPKITL